MTVSTVVNHEQYDGNGTTTTFPYRFRILKSSHMVVTVSDPDGIISTLKLGTDYDISGIGQVSGGNVILKLALAQGWKISLDRDLPAVQETDLRNQGRFFAETHEDAFDYLTMLIQRLGSLFGLALRKPSFIAPYYDALGNYIRNLRDPVNPQDAVTKNYVDALSGSNLSRTLRTPDPIQSLPGPDKRVNKIVGFDSNGQPILLIPESGSAADILLLLNGPDGYTYIPSIQIQRWKNNGDIRGWGAKCDGITYDDAAVVAAILATKGNITVPADTLLSTHAVFSGLNNFVASWINGARFLINDSFQFSNGRRAIVYLENCSDFTLTSIGFTGAKLDNVNAPEPWQDGDAGIEYYKCSGSIRILNARGKDVKTWGAIAVECDDADFFYDNPDFKNCQVQSGIGGTGYRSLTVVNANLYDIGLYGVELETRNRNVRTTISGGIARNCNKGFAAVHNSDNILVEGAKSVNCKVGFSSTSDDTTVPAYLGNGQSFIGCVATSCKTGFEFVNPIDLVAKSNVENRDDIDYFSRTRALDRIIRVDGNKAKFALDSSTESHGLAVGAVIQMDDGVQFTVAAIDSTPTADPVFGNLVGFTTTPAITSAYARSSFRRYIQVNTGKTSMVLYGGKNINITDNHFAWSETILASYGSHSYITWEGNTSYSCQNYFAFGSSGEVSGTVKIETGSNQNFGNFGSIDKFYKTLDAIRMFSFKGGTTNSATTILNALPIDEGFITGISCAINNGQTTTGTIVLKLNGNNVVTGEFSGTPLRASKRITPAIGVSGAATIQLVDTVGDLVASGYAVELKGAFK